MVDISLVSFYVSKKKNSLGKYCYSHTVLFLLCFHFCPKNVTLLYFHKMKSHMCLNYTNLNIKNPVRFYVTATAHCD